ncbi:MAG: hypothetical protein CL885_04535 [Dehalococcoidia bacterium]|nr:hypothetical protein [Dehalococcoidia bacterium]
MKVGDLVRFEGSNVFTPALRDLVSEQLTGIVVDIFLHPRRADRLLMAEILWPSGSVTRMRADIFKTISTPK